MVKSKLLELNNVGIVVENLANAIAFFTEIGLKLEGRATIEGEETCGSRKLNLSEINSNSYFFG